MSKTPKYDFDTFTDRDLALIDAALSLQRAALRADDRNRDNDIARVDGLQLAIHREQCVRRDERNRKIEEHIDAKDRQRERGE